MWIGADLTGRREPVGADLIRTPMTDQPDEVAGFEVICSTTLADVLDREQVMDGIRPL